MDTRDALNVIAAELAQQARAVEAAPEVRLDVEWLETTTFGSKLRSFVPARVTLRVSGPARTIRASDL